MPWQFVEWEWNENYAARTRQDAQQRLYGHDLARWLDERMPMPPDPNITDGQFSIGHLFRGCLLTYGPPTYTISGTAFMRFTCQHVHYSMRWAPDGASHHDQNDDEERSDVMPRRPTAEDDEPLLEQPVDPAEVEQPTAEAINANGDSPPLVEEYMGLRIEARRNSRSTWYDVYWTGWPEYARRRQSQHPMFRLPENGGLDGTRLFTRSQYANARRSIEELGGAEAIETLMEARPLCDCGKDRVRLTWNHVTVEECDECRGGDHSQCVCTLHQCSGCGCTCGAGRCMGCGCQSTEAHAGALNAAGTAYECGRSDCRRCNPPLEMREFERLFVRGSVADAEFLNRRRTVGMELEYLAPSGRVNTQLVARELPASIGIGSDGSVGSFPVGAEYCTPPGYGDDFERLVRTSVDVLQRAGYDAVRQAGLHVHVAASDLDVLDQWKMYALVKATEDTALSLVAPWRHGNTYCTVLEMSLSDALARIESITSGGSDGSGTASTATPSRRRVRAGPGDVKYNMAHFSSEYQTVEFRLHEATLDVEQILAWAGLCQALVGYTAESFDRDEVQALGSMATGIEKFEHLADLIDLAERARNKLRQRIEQPTSVAA